MKLLPGMVRLECAACGKMFWSVDNLRKHRERCGAMAAWEQK